jgi:hypothetical protein
MGGHDNHKDDATNGRKTPKLEPGSHPFEVDDSDHCETPLKAYQDLIVLLDRLLDGNADESTADGNNNRFNRKPRSSLRIYDPYYCDGGVKTKLASMGFTNVINENRDFYKDIATGQVPDYDVLVTNPPYSGHHMEKLLEFCASQQQTAPASSRKNKKTKKTQSHRRPRPSFLLLPHFVYTKDYYTRATSSLSSTLLSSPSFFSFLVPKIRYSYVPPTWVADRSGASRALSKGKETTAPFPSFWYCCHLTANTTNSNKDTNVNNTTSSPNNASNDNAITRHWLETTFGASGSISSQHRSSGLRYAATPVEIPRDFKGEFDPTKKRPNPRARKRMRIAATAAGARPPQLLQQQPQKKKRQRERDPKKKKKKRY